MRATLYRLYFKAPLHIGLEGIGAENIDQIIHSDTLWGALANAYLTLGLPFDFEKTRFLLSSAFPFYNDYLFFPLPYGALHYLSHSLDERKLKDLKKINYVEQPLFEALINGEQPSWTSLTVYEKNKAFALSRPCPAMEEKPLFQIHEVPRVSIDRYRDTAVEGAIFYFAQMVFAPQAGLFFLTRFRHEEEQNNFEAALRFLGDEGLGADRTVGKGLFEFQKQTLTLKTPARASQFVTLALYHPMRGEIEQGLLQKARYGLISRKGFAFHPAVRGKRRQFVRMFKEGSLFKRVKGENQLYGDIQTVMAAQGEFIPFDVKRYGMAFDVPAMLA